MLLDKYLQKESISIVFLGEFNPVILQPFWLHSKDLIREEEANNAKIGIIHPEIMKYELDWVSIEISKQRCEFKTNKAPYFDPMKDLAASVFKILRETPIKSLGINHIYNFTLPNQETYYEFGNILSPLNIWSDSMNDPRLLQLEILEENRKDGLEGQYRVRVSPTDENISNGVSVNLNDHYDIKNDQKGINMEMVECLEQNWAKSINRAKDVVEQLLSKTKL